MAEPVAKKAKKEGGEITDKKEKRYAYSFIDGS